MTDSIHWYEVFRDRFPRAARAIDNADRALPVQLATPLLALVSNYRAVFADASQDDIARGVRFFPDVRHECNAIARVHGVDERAVYDVFALVSPSKPVARNYSETRAIVSHYASQTPLLTSSGHRLFMTTRAIASCLARLDGHDCQYGHKTYDMAHSIGWPAYPASPCCDTWIAIAGIDGASGTPRYAGTGTPHAYTRYAISRSHYPYYQYAVLLAAHHDGYSHAPREYASIVWHRIRRAYARHYEVIPEYR